MRYDVFEHRLSDNRYTESNNLFDFKTKTLYSWDDKQNCTQCPQPTMLLECIPADWRIQDVIFVAGQKVQRYVDNMEKKRNSQSCTAASFGPTPWLLNILSYDDFENVIEAVQIQNFEPGVVTDPSSLVPPAFCANAPVCKSLEHHLQTNAAVLPIYLKRKLMLE